MRELTQKAAAVLAKLSPLRPQVGIILGSGFQGLAQDVETSKSIDFARVPGFVHTRIQGHRNRIVIGRLAGVPVILLCGRPHYYQGYSLAQVTFPVRVLAAFGVRSLLLTNAAGAINRKFRPGDFMCIHDHINFMGRNPLRQESASNEPSFVDLTETYDLSLRRLLHSAARRTKVRLHKGVYLAVSGPSYETPAEILAFARLGADAVGMSTVPEAIVAKQCGMAVAGLSCLTNAAARSRGKPISHAEVLETARAVQAKVRALIRCFLEAHWESLLT